MRVTFNSYREDSIPQINRNAANQAKLQQQISSGQNITTADQDPLTAQRILDLQGDTAQTQQYYQNAGLALDINKVAYNAVDGARQASDRASEIMSSVNDMTLPDQMTANATEINGLIEKALASANSQYDGKYLLGGTKNDAPPFVATRDADGNITGVTYNGAAKGPDFQTGPNSTVSPYPTGDANSAVADFMNNLVSTRDAFKSGNPSTVLAQNTVLQGSNDALMGTLADLGSQQKTLQDVQTTASTNYDNLNNKISGYNDVNLAQATIDLTKSQVAYQASLQATSKIMQHSLLDYL